MAKISKMFTFLSLRSMMLLFLFVSVSTLNAKSVRFDSESTYDMPMDAYIEGGDTIDLDTNSTPRPKTNYGAHKHLVHASMLFRHGDRTPTSTYPNDKYQDDDFPNGFGSLTNEGKKHSYDLGSVIRDRYIKKMKITGDVYDHRNVSFRSTDVRRTLETVQYMANGMYPLPANDLWMDSADWQAFPIHTVPKDSDQLLRPYDGNCRSMQAYLDQIRNTDDWLKYEEENKDFLQKISQYTGYDVTLWKVEHIYTALAIEKSMGYELPDWATDEVFTKLKELNDFTVQAYFSIEDKNYRTVSGGVFLQEVLDSFAKFDPEKDNKSFKLYSAHDDTLIAILVALGKKIDHNPNFNALLTFELYFDVENKESYVQLFFKDGNDAKFEEVRFDACHSICELGQFINIVKDIAVKDRSEACKLKDL